MYVLTHTWRTPTPPHPQDSKTKLRKTSWRETDCILWQGEAPRIDIQYDERYGFLLNFVIGVNARNTKLGDQELVGKFLSIMEAAGVLAPVTEVAGTQL